MSKKKRQNMLLDTGPVANKSPSINAAPVGQEVDTNTLSMADFPIEPAISGLLTIPLHHLREFEHNPRKRDNPEYPTIKESIEAGGLTHKIQATKRPQDNFYVLRAGGNTRLKALNALYQEALERGDAAEIAMRAVVTVDYHPYTNDVDLMALHLEENNTRGAMHFIDNAVGYSSAVNSIEDERKKEMGDKYKPLALKDMVDELKKRRFVIRRQLLAVYLYGSSIAEYFPLAFADNMGRPMVEVIRREENIVRSWCKAKGYSEIEEDTVEQFMKILSQFDQAEMSNAKFMDFQADAILQLGDAMGEPDISIEISNIREYKSLDAPVGEDRGVDSGASSNKLVDQVDDEDSVTGNDSASSNEDDAPAPNNTEGDSATAPKKEDPATVPKIDSKALIGNLKDFMDDNELLQVFFKEDFDLEKTMENGDDLDMESLAVVGSIAVNLENLSQDNVSNIHEAVEVSSYGDLITSMLVIKHLFLLMLDVNRGRNEQAADLVMNWYVSNRDNFFNNSCFENVVAVSEIMDSAVSVNSDVKDNKPVLDFLYKNYFSGAGMDSVDFEEFIDEYMTIKTIISQLP